MSPIHVCSVSRPGEVGDQVQIGPTIEQRQSKSVVLRGPDWNDEVGSMPVRREHDDDRHPRIKRIPMGRSASGLKQSVMNSP